MRLNSIKLAGFKSFVDPTTILLQSNLTAIVGPNGCGKSNVVDAIRWVIGESSAKHLRGESMTDVIFNGTNARKPVGQASVELIFDNSDGTLGGEFASYTQIAIRRVVNRDAQSTYYLNGNRCRRRDIINIFYGTGLGPRSYAIVEQGMISRLIEAKPEEMRVYLEEVAGISKYKDRRRETENRMNRTRENLERLLDLVEELDKQLAHLKRQANAAERYNKYKEEEHLTRAQLNALHCAELASKLSNATAETSEQETKIEELLAQQRQIDTRNETLRIQKIELNDTYAEVQTKYYKVGNKIAALEEQIKHTKERREQLQSDLDEAKQSYDQMADDFASDQSQITELTGILARLEPEQKIAQETVLHTQEQQQLANQSMHDWRQRWDEFTQSNHTASQTLQVQQTKADHLEQSIRNANEKEKLLNQELTELEGDNFDSIIGELQREVESLTNTTAEIEQQIANVQEQLQNQRNKRGELDQQISAQHREVQGLQSQLAGLQAQQQVALGKKDEETASWLATNGLDTHPRLVEQLNVDKGWESAIETVLGDYLEAVCVPDTSLFSATENMQQGHITLLHFQCEGKHQANPNTLLAKVDCPEALRHILANIYIAEDVIAGQALCQRLAEHESVITKDGVWFNRHWIRVNKAQNEHTGVIEREREIQNVETNLSSAQEKLDKLTTELADLKSGIIQAEQQRDELQHSLKEHNSNRDAVRARYNNKQAEKQRFEDRYKMLHAQISDLQTQARQGLEQLQSIQGTLSESQQLLQQNEEKKQALLTEKLHVEQAADDARQALVSARNTSDELQVRFESTKNQLELLQQNCERNQTQLDKLQQRYKALEELLEEVDDPEQVSGEQLQDLLHQRVSVETELSDSRANVEAVDQEQQSLEKQRHELEERVTNLRARLEKYRIDLQTFTVRRDTFLEQITENGFDLKVLCEEMPQDAEIDAWEKKIESLTTRIQRLGAINLAAIDEYDQLLQRKEHLDTQHADLITALETLESAIGKIDKETRAKFKETYDKVNGLFQEIFPVIFGGGRAYLELTDPDFLKTGVIVRAQPPGKRNTTIHLLSGGEKALTAISLVFALFRLNPAPFCVLDEVDAPLDDANVNRYCDLVSKMSEDVQFLFISHNKIAINMAKQLAGVTMGEPGVSRMVSVDIEEALAIVDEDA